MKRIILDTNIYGLIVEDPERDIVRNGIENKKAVIVYNLSLIRKELRDTPRNIRFEGENLRNYLLRIYFILYKELGGYAAKTEIIKDFIIVACASLNSLDIVVSNDNRTMLSEKAIKSYNIANRIKKIRMPRFLDYEKFKKEIK